MLAAIGFALFRRGLHGWLADDAPTPLRDRISAALPSIRTILDARPAS